MKSKFKFPAHWAMQQNLERPKPTLEFGRMLPKATGFVSKCGIVVMYGKEYATLKEAGMI